MDLRILKYVVLAVALAAGWIVSLALATPWTQPPSQPPRSDSEQAPVEVKLAEGKLQLTAPASWKTVTPAVTIIEAEFSIPAHDDDQADGRLTIMSAGGSIDANIDRWIGQFRQDEPEADERKTKREELKVADRTVHWVEISGTYLDQRGPATPVVARENYRMLGAILETQQHGNYFFKFYGPAKTVEANHQKFRDFIESLEVK